MPRYILVCAVLFQAGCATILGHNHHTMTVTSTPAGASVFLNGAPMGQTPVQFVVQDLGTPNALKIRLEGYEDESQRVLRRVQTVAFCNLFNFICWGVDYLSDSMFEIKNNEVHFDLRPRLPAAAPPSPYPAAAPPGAPLPSPTAPVEALPAPPPGEGLEPPPELSAPPLVAPPDVP
ncbi:MAG: PEGA domain-containing protein [Deltaproteobacteria bacterium]|nr:PEGA domain-containing protein [Deltaproteobacteria bacterium]